MSTSVGIHEPPQAPSHEPTASIQFLNPFRQRLLIFLISALLLVPCFWHSHIEAGDLGSHLYNAWLAQLVEQGRAPGVYVIRQWDNVLFDLMLFYFAKFFGLAAAEKIAVSLCVLIFFWGLFTFMKAASSRPPWPLAPCIAMLTYGYIFHMGFMNYYLSLGLACIGLALVWNFRRIGIIAAAVLAPLLLLAHPLGFLLFLGCAAYRFLWLKFPGAWKLLLPAVTIALFLFVHWFIAHQHTYDIEWRDKPFWQLSGADQFQVFGQRYAWFTLAIALFFLLSNALAFFQPSFRNSFWKSRLPLELYLVSFCGTLLLPENVQTEANAGWIGALATRLTLVTAIFGLCWFASLPLRSWHLVLSSVIAVVFFTFIYQDTAFLNRMEANTEKITRTLPFGTRTLSTIFAPNTYRTIYLHIPDRACIGHCFLFSNYEPSARQFRVRVRPGSPVVTASQDDSEDMQSGTYDVEDEDLPLKQIYQCDAKDLTRICIRDLAADEKNGRLGYHPINNPFFSQNP